MTRVFASTLTAAALAVVIQQPAWAEADAQQWLERMSLASRSLNYTGTFVYQHQNSLEAMRIVHAVDESGERERLLSLTGPKREVLRDNQIVTCILGDSQAVMVNKSRPRTPFPASFPNKVIALEKNYRCRVMGEDRVAGLPCRVVAVESRDDYRYGRRFCVHDQSHLLLRSQLTDAKGHVIEQMMFTTVTFPQSVSDKELLPNLDGANFTWQREPEQQADPGDSSRDSRWEVMQVPDGFMLTDHNWHQLSAHEPGVEHWVYSDGLASVSIYIEKSRKKHDVYSGRSHRGALNAFGTMVADHYVTVVGEVPHQTVELIGKSVRFQ